MAQSMSISNKLGARPGHWNLLIECCITVICHWASEKLLWKWYMTDKTKLDGQQLKAAQEQFREVGLHWSNNWNDETSYKKLKFMHVGMERISTVVVMHLQMIYTNRRRHRRNFWPQGFIVQGALRCLNWFPSGVIKHHNGLWGFQPCWEPYGWNQYSAILLAVVWGWWIDAANSYISCSYAQLLKSECCNCQSARPQWENQAACILSGGAW